MRESLPSVFLVARPSVDLGGMREYLADVGGGAWLDRRLEECDGSVDDAELLVEFAGRMCYRSWEPGLNPNVTRVRRERDEYFANLLRSLHGSVFEHANYSFAFRNVSRVFCYDADTEVLTSKGWKRWPDVDGTETFATLNPDTDQLEYQEADERFEGDYEGPMYRVRSEQVDLLVTPQHRMWVQRQDTRAGEQRFGVELATEIAGRRVSYQNTAGWTGAEQGVVELPAPTRAREREHAGAVVVHANPAAAFPLRAFARFLGWYLARGSLNGHHIVIAQSPGLKAHEIAATIEDLGLSAARPASAVCVRTCNGALRDFLARLGRRAHHRRVPPIVHEWGPETIREFLGAYTNADAGERRNARHGVVSTTSAGMADDLQVLAIKAGWSAKIRVDDRGGPRRDIVGDQVACESRRPRYIVSLVRTSTHPLVNHGAASAHDGWQHYAGKVYCVKVPNGLLFVRRNGKPVVSGNTHELVRHRAGSAFSQESLRYVRLTDIGFRVPPALEPVRDQVLSLVERLEEFQVSAAEELGLNDEGIPFSVKKEVTSALRRLAPIGLSTDIIWTANVRTLRHVIEMRTAEGAEEELRSVFDSVAETMCREAPDLFQDFSRTDAGAWVPEHRKV